MSLVGDLAECAGVVGGTAWVHRLPFVTDPAGGVDPDRLLFEGRRVRLAVRPRATAQQRAAREGNGEKRGSSQGHHAHHRYLTGIAFIP